MNPSCAACQFSRTAGTGAVSGEITECHRYAPRPAGKDTKHADWPIVQVGQWCGEFQPVEVQPPTLAQFMEWVQSGGYEAWLWSIADGTSVLDPEGRRDATARAVTEFLRSRGFPQ